LTNFVDKIKRMLKDISLYCEMASGLKLRSYQEAVAYAILDSVFHRKGLSFVVIFPRQSGKNELQAQLESYIMTMLSSLQAEIVKVSPTWKPQSLNAMRRLERVLKDNLITRDLHWTKEQGYIYRIGKARIFFLSGARTSNVVGATASTLLQCDEAQDVLISKWDKEIAPMAASTNATRVFWGTAWTSSTLLAREKRAALAAQAQDGIQRVFQISAEQVGKEVPAYAQYVAGEIQKHGRQHPFIRTQYFSEEIDQDGGMFNQERLERMQGDHPARSQPDAHAVYAITIDVAGQDENAGLMNGDQALANPNRDATALTIFEIDLSTMDDEMIQAPTYRSLKRFLWTGVSHSQQYAAIRDLIERWQPRYVVIDATGVGAGLASFLEKAYPHQTLPFHFSSQSKSALGWNFLTVIESGRYKEHQPVAGELEDLQSLFWMQCQHANSEIVPGASRIMRWQVPDHCRDPISGKRIHDDLLISAALVSVLDGKDWGQANSAVVDAYDPLSDMQF